MKVSLELQLFEIVAGRPSFFSNAGLSPGGLADVPESQAMRLTLEDLPLTPKQLDEALKRRPKRKPGMDDASWRAVVSAEAEGLAALLEDQVIHFRDAEIDARRSGALPADGES